MKTRAATSSDRDAVIALWQQCDLTRPWNDPIADFDRAMRWAGSVILVAEGDDELLATAMVGYDGHRGWVYYLAVSPTRQRSGLGKAIMAAAQDWLAEKGSPKIQLMVRINNERALKFYESLGLDRQNVATFGQFLDVDQQR